MSTYQISIRILLGTALWLLATAGLRAQDPTNPPVLPGNGAVTITGTGGSDYSSLAEALTAITADATVKLNISTTLDGTRTLAHNVVIDLNGQTLTCASGTTLSVDGTKTLSIKNKSTHTKASITGSFTYSGSLFIGSDVSLGGTVVYKGTTPHYRALVDLPAATGTVGNVYYGTLPVADASREGNELCCWLPQSSTPKSVTYDYTAQGATASATYLTDPLVVIGHSVSATPSRVDDGTDPTDKPVASATPTGGTKQDYKTLSDALKAVADKGGEVSLISPVSLSEEIVFTQPVSIHLETKSLKGEGAAALLATGNGKVTIGNGRMDGIFIISDALTADRTVALTASLLKDSRQVYRVRLVLPDNSYTHYAYDTNKYSKLPNVTTEGTDAVAYLWLPAHAATAVFLVAKDDKGADMKSKSKVTVETNHDNRIDLKLGDTQVKVYTTAIPGGQPYENFHNALLAVEGENGSRIELQTNVTLSGTTDHAHPLNAHVLTTIDLNGYTLTGSNCSFRSTATEACYLLTDKKGTGSLTGTLKIEGNLFAGSDISASKIGVVQTAVGKTLLYRMLVTIDDAAVTDGFASYTFGTTPSAGCYVKGGMACLWLPLDQQAKTLSLTKEGKTYSAEALSVSATHSNTARVGLPAVVAKIGNTEYMSLAEAFQQVTTDNTEIEVCAATSLNTSVSLSHQVKLTLGYPLRMESGAAFTVTAGGGLYIQNNAEKRGSMAGDFSIDEGVYISSSVPLTGQVNLNAAPVYRVQLILPTLTKVATYRFGSQGSEVYMSDENTSLGKSIGYAWLGADKQDLTVSVTDPSPAQNYTLLSANVQQLHINRFEMEAGGNVAKIGNQYYPSLGTALEAANNITAGGTIVLMADVVLREKNDVKRPITIDLYGFTLNTTADAFLNVNEGQSLTIDSNHDTQKGQMYGTLRLQGEVYVTPEVNLAGTIVRDGKEVFRILIEGLPMTGDHLFKGVACVWIPPVTQEYDLALPIDGVTFEATLLPGLPDHNARQKAYPLVSVKAGDPNSWLDETYTDHNVMVEAGVTLTIPATSKLARLHRVTLMNDAQIQCEKEDVLATGGIIYRRTFTQPNQWEAFSLPFDARRITAPQDGERIEMQPYQATGTGGHFWLKTLSGDGSFSHVTEEKVKANIGYIIAVPENLTTKAVADMAVDFVSADNQYLKRNRVPAVAPATKGFRQLANGTLREQPLTQPFYLLSADGKAYERHEAPAMIAPFSSYLLADQATTNSYTRLAIGELPTANEDVSPALKPLQLYTRPGYLVVRSNERTLLVISATDGHLVRTQHLAEGETVIALPQGIYFVNRQKIVVR